MQTLVPQGEDGTSYQKQKSGYSFPYTQKLKKCGIGLLKETTFYKLDCNQDYKRKYIYEVFGIFPSSKSASGKERAIKDSVESTAFWKFCSSGCSFIYISPPIVPQCFHYCQNFVLQIKAIQRKKNKLSQVKSCIFSQIFFDNKTKVFQLSMLTDL